MSGELVLLDSVILIDHFNGVEPSTEYLADVAPRASITPITRAEVLTGFDEPRTRRRARQLLDRLNFIPLDAVTSDRAAELRRAEGWRLPDAFHAAVAILNELLLVTRNTRDFPPDRYDYVVVPYSI